MSVRRRTWRNGDGSLGEAWVVNYTDAGGKRRLKSFNRKREAESFEAAVAVRMSVLVSMFLTASRSRSPRRAGYGSQAAKPPILERCTLDAYRQRVMLHIVPFPRRRELSQLSVPRSRLEDAMRSGPFTDDGASGGHPHSAPFWPTLMDRGLVGTDIVRGCPTSAEVTNMYRQAQGQAQDRCRHSVAG